MLLSIVDGEDMPLTDCCINKAHFTKKSLSILNVAYMIITDCPATGVFSAVFW